MYNYTMMHPGLVFIWLWIAFAVSWLVAAFWQRTTEKRAGESEVWYRLVLVVGGVALAVPARRTVEARRLWHVGWWAAWACVAAIAVGMAFAWWGRLHLGSLWSPNVTKKVDHRVVDTGPYRIVRHPIYTGLLLAVYATAAAKGTVPGLVGAVIITVGISMKARLEERWLRQELGPDSYDAYSRRVPMLVPFGRVFS
jgi:protein-S-isoprenylcysteine O-methyltransferase Ste14